MVDGAALLDAQTYALLAAGMWKDERGANLLDSGAAFYDSYRMRRRPMALGRRARAAILRHAQGEARACSPTSSIRACAPSCEALFRRQPRDHWCALLEGTDACVAPVLSLTEAPDHPHNAAARHLRHRRRHPPARPRAPLQGSLTCSISPAAPPSTRSTTCSAIQVRKFFDRELTPHLDRWEEQGEIDKRLLAQGGRGGAALPDRAGGLWRARPRLRLQRGDRRGARLSRLHRRHRPPFRHRRALSRPLRLGGDEAALAAAG